MKTRIGFAFLLALVPSLLHGSDTAEQQEALKRLQLAVSKTNVFELPSFEMKASVQVENNGKPLDGSLHLLWAGPDQWKEEIRFPGYTEIQVGGKGTVWIQRSTDFIPLRVFQLHSALGFGSGLSGPYPGPASFVRLNLTPRDKVKKMRSRKEHGEKLTCIEVQKEGVTNSSEICTDEDSGTIVRGTPYTDGDFQSVGGKIFPRSIALIENGVTVAKVGITELSTPSDVSPNLFTIPTGVVPQVGCMNPTPPRLVNRIPPEYPSSARQRHVEGTVYLDTEIGITGVPIIKKVVVNTDQELVRASEEAVRVWRYDPATCDGKPVSIETILQVNFTLTR